MVYSESERRTLESEPDWRTFLTENSEAEVVLAEAGEVTVEMAEWYCRWAHADRVYKHLNRIPDDSLRWGRVNIRDALGELCRSHNVDVATVKTMDTLQNDYLEAADLKFCAILLRLADILDLDSSRSPGAVYRSLGLSQRTDKRAARSDDEWLKHLNSDGFRFPEQRAAAYRLGFVAGPSHPAVEYDIRVFLDEIEAECQKCMALLPFLAVRWHSFVLPDGISRENIRSNGYRFGEYRFVLDQTQVLSLFTGEKLYKDHHVFVRELLQNAIDTSRYREFAERVRGSANFKAEPIRVSEWRDAEGCLWIRIDDFGMGMDEEIIRGHLLRVGSSYYRSAKFRAEMIRARKDGAPDFVPISQFGIGLLSCFIMADRVEIGTRCMSCDGQVADPLRLSVHGLHGFYSLQTGNIKPSPMPTKDGDESGYRREIGTSIAVRLDPRKEGATFDLRSLLEEQVFASPIPIELDGQPVGNDYASMIEQPWCEPTVVDFLPEAMAELCEFTGYEFAEPLKVAFIPLDLTSHSPTPEFKGQILAAVIQPTEEWRRFRNEVAPLFQVLVPDWSDFAERRAVRYDTEQETLSFTFVIETSSYANRAEFIGRLTDQSADKWDKATTECLSRLTERIAAARTREYSRSTCSSPTEFVEVGISNERGPLFYAGGCCSVTAVRVPRAVGPVARRNIRAVTNCPSDPISYNGLLIPPTQITRFESTFSMLPLKPNIALHGALSYPGRSWGAVALSDSLRPEVDVARGSVLRAPLRAYSTAIVSLHRCLKTTEFERHGRADIPCFTFVFDKEPPTFGRLIEENILQPEIEWEEIPLFLVDEDFFSLKEVKNFLEKQGEVRFRHRPDGDVSVREWSPVVMRTFDEYPTSFNRICAGAIAQLELSLEIRFRGDQLNGFFAKQGAPQRLQPGQRFFPPLTFIPYNNGLFVRAGYGANLNHPLSQWLIGAIPRLADRYPGIFNQLRSLLVGLIHPEFFFENRLDWDCGDFRESINKILKRMTMLEREFRPSKALFLRHHDVMGWTNRPRRTQRQ
jgi:hypothetical protein